MCVIVWLCFECIFYVRFWKTMYFFKMLYNVATSSFTSFTHVFHKNQDKVFTISFNNLSYLGEFSHENKANCFTYNLLKSWISCKVFLIFSLSFMISNIVFIAFIVFFRKPFFNRITNSTLHKKIEGQEVQKSASKNRVRLRIDTKYNLQLKKQGEKYTI